MKLFIFLATLLLVVSCGDDRELPSDYQAYPEASPQGIEASFAPPPVCPPKQECPDPEPCPKCPDQKPDQKPKDPDQNIPPDPKPPKQDPDQKPDQKPPKQDPSQNDPDPKDPKDPLPPSQEPLPPVQDLDQKTCICQNSDITVVVDITNITNTGGWCQDTASGAWYQVNECN